MKPGAFLSAKLKRRIALFAACFSVIQLAACGSAPMAEDRESPTRDHLVHVSSNGWHTAIVLPASAFASGKALPEAADFPNAVFFEFGWGDRAYYPAKEKTFGKALSAALLPSPAIMHIAALKAPPKGEDSGLEALSLKLTEEGFQRLIQAIAAEFERPQGGRAKAVSRGLYPESRFYHARGTFHLLNTCNTWTARMLKAGGVAIVPAGVVTAGGLMSRLREALAAE